MNEDNTTKRIIIIVIIIIIITRQVLGRPVCNRGAISEDEKLQRGEKQTNNID